MRLALQFLQASDSSRASALLPRAFFPLELVERLEHFAKLIHFDVKPCDEEIIATEKLQYYLRKHAPEEAEKTKTAESSKDPKVTGTDSSA